MTEIKLILSDRRKAFGKAEKVMIVNRTDESFLSSDGKNRIHYFVYRPSGQIKGVVQISHGMCEHIGRYEDFAAYLSKQGFAVYGHDHLGHGCSAPDKHDLGFFGEDFGWQHLVDDVYEITKIAKREYPMHKIFLIGHSMGSFIARLYFMKYGKNLSGLILSGTSGGNQLNNVGLVLTDFMIKTKGKRHRSKLLKKMMFGNYNKRYSEHRTENDWISRDNEIVDTYNADEYCTFTFTNAAVKDLLTMLKMISDDCWAESVPKEVPVFLLSGDMDPVGDYGKGVKKVYERLRNAGVKEVSLKLYPGGRHEMLNETNRSEVYADILSWLNEKAER